MAFPFFYLLSGKQHQKVSRNVLRGLQEHFWVLSIYITMAAVSRGDFKLWECEAEPRLVYETFCVYWRCSL